MSDLLTTRAWSAVERDDLTDALVTVRSLREREKSRSSGCEVAENRPDSGAANDSPKAPEEGRDRAFQIARGRSHPSSVSRVRQLLNRLEKPPRRCTGRRFR